MEPPAFSPLAAAAVTITGFLVAFVAWVMLTRWRRLARRYPSVALVEGERFGPVLVRMGSDEFSMRRVPVNATVGSEGLALAGPGIFATLFPKMFIPWSQVESATRQGLIRAYVLLRLVNTQDRVILFGRLGETVLATASRAGVGATVDSLQLGHRTNFSRTLTRLKVTAVFTVLGGIPVIVGFIVTGASIFLFIVGFALLTIAVYCLVACLLALGVEGSAVLGVKLRRRRLRDR
jgi:hypothetical protein